MTFPLPDQPTWNIKDSTKLTDYTACPRKYFYNYVLGWKTDEPAHDLHFGESWHRAREHQLIHGYDDVQGAFDKFITHYRSVFPESTDSLFNPKTPTAALHTLMKFAEERGNDLLENEVVILDGEKMTEISGKVPVDDHRYLHYRMDSIMRRLSDGKIFSWDHKSTTAKSIVYPSWSEQFYLGIQNGTYTHCLYCQFPIEEVLGVEFCGVGFEFLSKGSSKRPAGYYSTFKRVPAYKDPGQMNAWLWNVNRILDEIDQDMDMLMSCSEDETVMMAFRMNPNSCTMYRGCPYHDFCCSFTNPLQQCYEPPLGFRVEFWDPSAMQTTVKKDLEWRG